MTMRVLAIIALVGCTYTAPTDTSPGPMGDGPAPFHDGPTMCPAKSTECIGAKLRSCDAVGVPSHDDDCLWGCTATGGPARCGQLLPAGGGVQVTDLDSTGLGDVAIFHGTVDGNNGSISGVPQRAAGAGPDQGIAYVIRNNVAIFRMKSLHITGGITALGGDHPIAFVADGPIVIDDVIDARGPCTTTKAGPGGSPGGVKNTDGSGSGKGDGSGVVVMNTGIGGGGGGFGGSGGRGALGFAGIDGGGSYGNANLTVLIGGSGGGGGAGSGGGAGGGGGGAVQLVSNTSITINGTGGINSGGCGGKGGAAGNSDAGGGAGAGGAILLEAPVITIAGSLAVNGGGGGNKGADGKNGSLDRNRVGGNGGGNGQPGRGGAGNTKDGEDGSLQGGAGGAVGWIRFDLKIGTAAMITGTMSPAVGDMTTASQGDAQLQ